LRLDGDTVNGKYNAGRLIEGETYAKLVGKSGTIFRTPTLMEAAPLKQESPGAQEITMCNSTCRDGKGEQGDQVREQNEVAMPGLN